ncbi:MAG: hypothetical protein IPH45_14705 [Bacteroidales bacterium]|nr:hypothetical protein [Bacteroidales bacterium]
MKKNLSLLVVILLMLSMNSINAQINIGRKVETKVNNRVNNKIDRGIDKGLDEIEKGIKGKEKA